MARVAEKEKDLPMPGRWMTTCFKIALHHGCRLSETSVPMSSIDFVRGTIRFVAKGKNGRAKIYTNRIHPAIIGHLRALKDAGASVTCTLPQMASKEWHTLLKGCEETKHICFHSTRVTVITRLARAGVPVQQAMAYVGHASETIHRIYQRLRAEDLSSCATALAFPTVSPSPGHNGAGPAHDSGGTPGD
jgi:integrase